MASEIKVDTIVNAGGDNDTGIDLATNDQILLKVANATKLTMNSTGQTTIVGEGGTTTTSMQQGLCKSWHQCDENTALDDSFNTASITDTSTGIHMVTFTSNMGNADYSGGACARLNTSGGNAFLRFSDFGSCPALPTARAIYQENTLPCCNRTPLQETKPSRYNDT